MKKNLKLQNFKTIKNYRKLKKILQAAKKRKNKKLKKYRKEQSIDAIKSRYRFELERKRKKIRQQIFNEFLYTSPPKEVIIDGEFGIESNENIDYFYDVSEELIDSNTQILDIILDNCTRVWPSGVTLMCSLVKWIELGKQVTGRGPNRIGSTKPKDNVVNEYLAHCGFYKYVGANYECTEALFNKGEVVEIQRETEKQNIENREIEIIDLLKNWSTLTEDQIELVDCVILTEIVNNIIEHGVTCFDQGWWILAQYHKKHGIISLNLADNGLGIRLSLSTGPQKEEITKKIIDTTSNEHNYILYAFEENISGAFNASTKDEGIFKKRYSSGSRRGNGLKHIRNACQKAKIKLSVLSHYGYVHFDINGKVIYQGSRKNRIFAGTMYQLIIPAKKEIK